VLDCKQLHFYLSDDVFELLQAMLACVRLPEALAAAEASPALLQLDFYYVSEVQVFCRSSASSLCSPVMYLPNLALRLAVVCAHQPFLHENSHCSRQQLDRYLASHYKSELSPKKLCLDNYQHIGLLSQTARLLRGASMVFQALRSQETSPLDGLHEMLEGLLWNLLRAGDLSASAVTDLLHSLGFRGLEASRLLKKLRSQLFLLDKGDLEALKR